MDVKNPRTGKVDYSFEATTPDQVAVLAHNLRAKHSAWADLTMGQRASYLLDWADALAAAKDSITAALTTDTGRSGFSNGEVMGAIGNIRRWAGLARQHFCRR